MSTEQVITNVTVWAGPEVQPQTGWMHVKEAGIVAIGGAGDEVPACDLVIDGAGRHILPGFADCHTHLSTSAWIPLAGDASGWMSAQDALQGVRRAADATAGDSWLLFMNLDYTYWPGRKYPTAEELEVASGGRRVLLVDGSLHRAIASESALADCGFTDGTHDPYGDISRGKRGKLTGEIWERAFTAALTKALRDLADDMGPDGLAAMLDREAERHLAHGVIDAHDPCVPISIQPFMSALNARSRLRLSWAIASDKGFLDRIERDDVYEAFGEGRPTAKVFLDGAHRCAMCMDGLSALSSTVKAFTQSLKNRNLDALREMGEAKSAFKDGHLHLEYLRYDQQELDAKLDFLSNEGLRLKIHAIGNLAAKQAMESVARQGRRDEVTLEHLMFMGPDEIESLARAGAVASVQPGFIPNYGPSLLDRGTMRKVIRFPAQALLDAGIPTSLSSDNPCGPLDPLHNVRCAVDRRTSDGRILDGDEALDKSAALKAATVNGTLGITGKPKPGLEAGAPADFVICTGDPFAPATQVESTWIGGEKVWSV